MDTRECLLTLGQISRRATRRTLIMPELAEEALRRLGDRHLDRDQQAIVLRVIAMPDKVKWPDWWEVLPG